MAFAVAVPRRMIAIGLTVIAAFALVFVAAALWNPWRFTALYPFAQAGGAVAVLVLAGALVATAALLTVRRTVKHAVFGLLIALVAIPALCVGLPVIALADTFREPARIEVMATSPSGDYSIVKVIQTTEAGEPTRLLVRSRAGLFSSEAAIALAQCPTFDPFSRGVPPEAVRFTSDNTVAVPVNDQPTTVVRFDPDTLEPEQTLLLCPDPVPSP